MGYSPCSCKESDMPEHTDKVKTVGPTKLQRLHEEGDAQAARGWSWTPLSNQAFLSARSQKPPV